MQMLVVFTGKTFGLQIVELSKPFIIKKLKICIDLCKFQNAVKSVATAPFKIAKGAVMAPVKAAQRAVHVVADTLHPGEQEEECASAYALAFELNREPHLHSSPCIACLSSVDLWARL